MKYSRNAVYTRVRNAVKTEYPDAYVTGVVAAVPSQSPAVMVHEVGHFHNSDAVTLGGSQGVWTSTFEAQVFSNRKNTGMTECYSIMDTVTAAFVNLGFILTTQLVVEDGTDGKYRLTARFRRVIGDGETLPTT